MNFSNKKTICLLSASISSLGTVPYGYQFASFLIKYSNELAVIVGVILAVTAAVANTALGTYSLLQFNLNKHKNIRNYLLPISAVSAISFGFMNFFAYQKLLPLTINVVASIAVVLTNAAIAYVALLNVMDHFQAQERNVFLKTCIKWAGFALGATVSLTTYAAAGHGLHQFMNSELAFTISIIIWIPNAALFGHATSLCCETCYTWLSHFTKNISHIHKIQMWIFIIALLSAASYTQVAITFFNPKMNIPELFKLNSIQYFIYHFLVPATFFASFSLNYLALFRIMAQKKT